MVAHIVKHNKWEVPIYFAVTVSDGNKLGLNDNLIMEGMGYRIVPTQGKNRVDPDMMWKFYMEEFKFRGLDDTTVYKNENDTRLVANYVSGFLQLADTLKRTDELEKAITVVEKSIAIFPDEWRHRAYLAMLYAQAGQLENIDKIIEGVETGQVVQLLTSAARDALYTQKFSEAKELLKMALQHDPNSKTAFNNLLFIENQVGNFEAVDSLEQAWRIQNADNAAALAELDRLLNSLKAQRPK
jgi:tetratricopeptide (TPR) repeat protein